MQPQGRQAEITDGSAGMKGRVIASDDLQEPKTMMFGKRRIAVRFISSSTWG